jgi:hypothetical protein
MLHTCDIHDAHVRYSHFWESWSGELLRPKGECQSVRLDFNSLENIRRHTMLCYQ